MEIYKKNNIYYTLDLDNIKKLVLSKSTDIFDELFFNDYKEFLDSQEEINVKDCILIMTYVFQDGMGDFVNGVRMCENVRNIYPGTNIVFLVIMERSFNKDNEFTNKIFIKQNIKLLKDEIGKRYRASFDKFLDDNLKKDLDVKISEINEELNIDIEINQIINNSIFIITTPLINNEPKKFYDTPDKNNIGFWEYNNTLSSYSDDYFKNSISYMVSTGIFVKNKNYDSFISNTIERYISKKYNINQYGDAKIQGVYDLSKSELNEKFDMNKLISDILIKIPNFPNSIYKIGFMHVSSIDIESKITDYIDYEEIITKRYNTNTYILICNKCKDPNEDYKIFNILNKTIYVVSVLIDFYQMKSFLEQINCKVVYVTGDDSLILSIYAHKLPLYETMKHKEDLFKSLVDIIEHVKGIKNSFTYHDPPIFNYLKINNITVDDIIKVKEYIQKNCNLSINLKNILEKNIPQK